jgi:hypothetical protein
MAALRPQLGRSGNNDDFLKADIAYDRAERQQTIPM